MSVLSLEESLVQLKHDLLDVFHFSPGYARLRAWSWVKYHLYQQIFPIPLPGNFQVTWRVLTSLPDLPVHEIVDLNFSLRSSTEWAISFVMGTALQVIESCLHQEKVSAFPVIQAHAFLGCRPWLSRATGCTQILPSTVLHFVSKDAIASIKILPFWDLYRPLRCLHSMLSFKPKTCGP